MIEYIQNEYQFESHGLNYSVGITQNLGGIVWFRKNKYVWTIKNKSLDNEAFVRRKSTNINKNNQLP